MRLASRLRGHGQAIERHYSAFITDALEEMAARTVVPLAPAEAQPLLADFSQLPCAGLKPDGLFRT